MAVTLAITGDQHCGSTVGLCPEVVLLPDGGEYHASPEQLWLLEKWREYWQHVGRITHKADDLIVVWNGDEVDGRGRTPVQRFSSNMTVQRAAFREVQAIALEACGREPDEQYFTCGTPYHAGEEAENEAEIAQGQGKDVMPRLKIEIEGVLLWVQHSAWGAYRPWTKGNNATRMASAILNEAADRGFRVPNVLITNHRHIVSDSGVTFKSIRAVVSPAWQLTSEWALNTNGGFMLADIGGVILRIEDGRYDLEVVRYEAAEEPAIVWERRGAEVQESRGAEEQRSGGVWWKRLRGR